MNQTLKGYVAATVAAVTYGMNPLFALPLYENGMDADSVLFFRYLFAIPLLGCMIKARGRSFRLKRNEILPLVVMGLLVAVSSLTLFESYRYMDAGIASTLLFVYPIMVALIMSIFFKERFTVQTGVCILLAICGILLLYRSESGAMLSLTGSLLVMGSALSYAFYLIGANRSVLKDMPTLKLTFYVLLFGVSLFVMRLDFCQTVTVPTFWPLWGNLLALAVFPTAISFLCTTIAVQCIGSTPTAIMGALEPLTAVFFGVMVFGEQLTPRIVYGMALIISAVTLVIVGGRMPAYIVRLRKMFPRLSPIRHWRRRN